MSDQFQLGLSKPKKTANKLFKKASLRRNDAGDTIIFSKVNRRKYRILQERIHRDGVAVIISVLRLYPNFLQTVTHEVLNKQLDLNDDRLEELGNQLVVAIWIMRECPLSDPKNISELIELYLKEAFMDGKFAQDAAKIESILDEENRFLVADKMLTKPLEATWEVCFWLDELSLAKEIFCLARALYRDGQLQDVKQVFDGDLITENKLANQVFQRINARQSSKKFQQELLDFREFDFNLKREELSKVAIVTDLQVALGMQARA